MKIAIGQMREIDFNRLRFIKQLGVDCVIFNTPNLPGKERWEFMDLLNLRTTCEDFGLVLGAIENIPREFYIKAMLNLPGRDEQIENCQTVIRNMDKAGIPILGYNWMPNGVWRTSTTTFGRGGARVTSFDHDLVESAPLTYGREYSEEEMWDNYEYFLKAILPVAEESGVKLALHPDDPPVKCLGGIPRIFSSVDGLKRAMEIVPSDSHGLEFCQGTLSEMVGDVIPIIKYFGEQGKIFYVHFRNVKGIVPKFCECFIDEGNVNAWEALREYKKVGFNGMIIPDHVPCMEGDLDEWPDRGRAYTIGYMKALVEALNWV